MTHEQHIEILARLEAVETLVAMSLALTYERANAPIAAIEKAHAGAVKKFAERTFKNAKDPAVADHYADEVKHHVELTLSRALQQLKDTYNQ